MNQGRIRANFNPQEWGGKAWNFIHVIAQSYPTNPTLTDKQLYKDYFRLLGRILPCESCCVNYQKHWNKYPIDDYLVGPEELFEWTVLLRQAISDQIAAKQQSEGFNNIGRKFQWIWWLIPIVLILVVLYWRLNSES